MSKAVCAVPDPKIPEPVPASASVPTRAEEISRAAVALFLERGYDNTPLSLIAQQLGITKAGLYHHFESKEHLLFFAHRDSIERNLVPILERAEHEPDPEQRLNRYLREYAGLMGSDPAIRLLIDEAKRLSPENLQAIRGVWRRGYRLMRRSIEELQAAGRCDPHLDPAFAAFAAIGMCTWTLYWFDAARQEQRDELGDTFSRIFLNGVLDFGRTPRDPHRASLSGPETDSGAAAAEQNISPGGER